MAVHLISAVSLDLCLQKTPTLFIINSWPPKTALQDTLTPVGFILFIPAWQFWLAVCKLVLGRQQTWQWWMEHMSKYSGSVYLQGGASGGVLPEIKRTLLWPVRILLPTHWSLWASLIKSFNQGDLSCHHDNTQSRYDASCSTVPIKGYDGKAWNATGPVTHFKYSFLELRVGVCACMCVCELPSGSSSLSIPRCCSALLKACSSLSIADVFFSTVLQSKSSGLQRKKRNQQLTFPLYLYFNLTTEEYPAYLVDHVPGWSLSVRLCAYSTVNVEQKQTKSILWSKKADIVVIKKFSLYSL